VKLHFAFQFLGKLWKAQNKTKECDISSKYQASVGAYVGSLPTILSKSLNFNFAQERD